MKKEKKILSSIFLLFLAFFIGWFFNSYNNSIYNKMLKLNDKEKNKYNEMLELESKTDIANYLSAKVDSNETIQLSVMDYLFEDIYKNASNEEKYLIFYTYYRNIQTYIAKYEGFLNDSSYIETVKKSFTSKDGLSLSKIKDADDYLLQTILTEMFLNDFVIYLNEPYIQVSFNWEGFLEKFDHILDEDYKEFCKLEIDGSNIIINPNYNDINMQGIVWYIVNHENYIKKATNPYLKESAEDIYVQNLFLFSGVSDSGLFYSSEYNISESYMKGFEYILEKHPDSDTSRVIKEVYDYVVSVDGTEDVLPNISTIIYNYLENLEWLANKPSNSSY